MFFGVRNLSERAAALENIINRQIEKLLCINGYVGIDWMKNTEKSKNGI